MQSFDRGLFVFETQSIPAGYRVLDAVTRVERTRVLDAYPCGAGRFLVLAQGPSESLRSAQESSVQSLSKEGAQDIVDHAVIAPIDDRALEALFSLAKTELAESLLVLECGTVSGALIAAQNLILGQGLAPIEIKIHRSSRGGAFGFFSGTRESCEAAATSLHSALGEASAPAARSYRIEVIGEPAPAFRSFFQLTE